MIEQATKLKAGHSVPWRLATPGTYAVFEKTAKGGHVRLGHVPPAGTGLAPYLDDGGNIIEGEALKSF